MDKRADLQFYYTLSDHPSIKNDVLRKRKVLQTRTLKISPDDHLSYSESGKLLASWGHTEQCIFPLKKAIIICPYKLKTNLVFADALLKLTKYNEDKEPHLLLIKTLHKLKRLEEIQTIYQEIANMIKDPDDVPFLYFKSAEILVKENHYVPALGNYKKAFETNTGQFDSSFYSSQYGQALLHEGLLEEALIQFEYVLKISPNNSLSLNSIAYCHYCLGKVQKAFEEYENIFKNKQHGFGTYSGMILVLYHLEKSEKVMMPYKERLQTIQRYFEERNSQLDIYKVELKKTELLLKRDDLDRKTREFNQKKQKGLSKVLALLQ